MLRNTINVPANRTIRGYGVGLSATLTKLLVEERELGTLGAWAWLLRQWAESLAGSPSEVTNVLLQDSIVGLERFLMMLFAKAIAWYEDYAFLAGNGAKLTAGIFRRDGLLEIAFDSQVKPFLGALLDLEAHARREPQDPQ